MTSNQHQQPHYNTAADAAQFVRDNQSIEPKTNRFTLLSRSLRDDNGQDHASLIFYETETGMVHGTTMDGDVFIGFDARSTMRRTFMTIEQAREYVVRYLEARAADLNRKLVLIETDGRGQILVPSKQIIRPS